MVNRGGSPSLVNIKDCKKQNVHEQHFTQSVKTYHVCISIPKIELYYITEFNFIINVLKDYSTGSDEVMNKI